MANGESVVAAEEVQVDDVCRVFPGETVPVDGVVESGETSIDESVMTGESMPVDKRAGDAVLAAGAESLSEHPLGRAIVSSYREETGREAPAASEFEMIPGRGVKACAEGCEVLVGSAQMMVERGVSGAWRTSAEGIPSEGDRSRRALREAAAAYEAQGCTVSLVAVDGALAGIVALADTVREDAADTVASLDSLGVRTTMATGDHEAAANHIAEQTGVSSVRANCFPEDKMAAIEEYERAGENVAMVGDGVNDAPALKRAYVGIAMGGVGSDIAVDAADIVLVHDGIDTLPHLFALARRMMITIKCNLTFSMTLNFVAIVLAITGLMGPVIGALIHNAGSVLVIVNSALLLRWKSKKLG